jgi:hypothetical protein
MVPPVVMMADDEDDVLIMFMCALCSVPSCRVKYEAQASCGAVSSVCCSTFICAFDQPSGFFSVCRPRGGLTAARCSWLTVSRKGIFAGGGYFSSLFLNVTHLR